jgi:probable F420-dependent oxidoreductase
MKIGIQPANSGSNASPDLLIEVAERADALGFDSLLITDHVVLPVEYSSPYPYSASGRMAASADDPFFEPLSTIGFLAGRTRRIRLGTSVLIGPYRHPVPTARYLACLDQLSSGRIVIGLGVGWMAEEFTAVQAPPFAERGAVTDEVIGVFRAIWRDQPASFHGAHFRFEPVGAMPKPVQPGGIPILIGGESRPAMRRAVRLGDGWQPFKLPPEVLDRRLDYVRAQAQAAGRDLSNFIISMRLGLRLTSGPTERRSSEEPGKCLVGTPDQVAADMEAYQKRGVTEVVFDFRSCTPDETRETLQLAGKELIPRFA